MIKLNNLKIFKIFGVILCILSMTSCKTHLNKFTEQEIKEEYVEFRFPNCSAEDISILYYVGEYNDYHILMLQCYVESFSHATVTEFYDDEKITYGNTNRLWAYKDEQFYRLPELYQDNELTKEDIISIRETFYQLEEENNFIEEDNETTLKKPYLNGISKNIIKNKYVKQFYPDKSPKDFYVEYYVGKYNGYKILMFSLTDKNYFEVTRMELFGTMGINYYNEKSLIAYKNGEFFSLQELYKRNKLKNKDIHKINQTFDFLRNI